MKVHHFLSEKWALEALKTQRIKVSRYDDLNDPFELMAMALDDKVSRTVMLETKKKINEKLRILCCSKRWKSPLLWGHYAQKHTGIALTLEVPDSSISEITYSKDRASLDLHALMNARDDNAKQEMFKMYTTKFEQWSYEEEVRVQFELDEVFRVGDFDFYKLGQDLKVVGIVLGPLNTTDEPKIRNNLPKGMEIDVTTTRVAFKSFDIVHQKLKPTYKLKG